VAHTVIPAPGTLPDIDPTNSPPPSTHPYFLVEPPAASQPPSIHVFTRHSTRIDKKTGNPVCSHADDRDYKNCRCPKWVYVRRKGSNQEKSAHTRSWAEAEAYARKLATHYDPMEQALQLARQEQHPKVEDLPQAIEDFLAAWTDDEKEEGTVSKLRTTLRHKLLPWANSLLPPIVYLHQLEPEHIDRWKQQLRQLTPGKESLAPLPGHQAERVAAPPDLLEFLR
jgi:hypothetical protein